MSFTRRSARAITTVPQYSNFRFPTEVVNNSIGSDVRNGAQKMVSEPAVKDVAVAQSHDTETDPKLRKPKVPKAIRRNNKNRQLSKILAPKSALMLLNELKPGVKFDISWPSGIGPMFAQAIHDGKVLGQGEGRSKSAAKNAAAEAAFKRIVKEKMEEIQKSKGVTVGSDAPMIVADDPDKSEDETQEMSAYEQLPWAGLASFALFRLFSQWHVEEGMDVPLPGKTPYPMNGSKSTPVAKPATELPANAAEMHPVSLINQMFRGIKETEINRSTDQTSSTVTVGYYINETMYTGTATNKKTARKEAASRACSALYNLNFN